MHHLYAKLKSLLDVPVMANRKKDKKLVRVTVSVDPDDYVAIEAMAKKSNLSTAWLIRQAMHEYLANHSNNLAISITLDK